MKITDVKIVPISCPYPATHSWKLGLGDGVKRDEILVFIETDEGITGIGESYHGFAPEPVITTLRDYYRPLLIGQDPSFIEDLWHEMFFSTLQLGNVAVLAMSGVDQALWDIRGKAAGKPVYQLLGATAKNKVPAYIGCHCFGWKAPELLLEEAQMYIEQGFKAIKLRGGMGVQKDLEAARVVREGVDPDIDIMVDANSAYSFVEAVQLAKGYEAYNIFWFESPFDFTLHNHHNDIGRLRKLSHTAIGSGGNLFTRFQFRNLIEQGGVDVVTPDAGKCGGFSEGMKIATMASALGILIAPHSTAGLNMVANMHYTASLPDHVMCYLEWDAAKFNPPRDEIVATHIEVKDGFAILPDAPGLGVELDMKAIEKYPFISGGEVTPRPRSRRWDYR
ncbi:MAG: mandelate racemase/muconate lactonizing enzyme family protein [Peptococcaceae bacterium]